VTLCKRAVLDKFQYKEVYLFVNKNRTVENFFEFCCFATCEHCMQTFFLITAMYLFQQRFSARENCNLCFAASELTSTDKIT